MGNTSSREDVKLQAEIGRGSYAVVYKAVWMHKPVAAKKLHPILFEKREIAKKFREEWEMLSSFNHENIVKYLTAVLPQTPDDTPIIVTELLEQDLRKFIRNSKTNPKVSFGKTVSIMLDVAQGLDYLHQAPRFIVHRDMASKNILLTSTGQAKIADFGFAKAFPEGEMIASANPGTEIYRAPETFGRLCWSRKATYSEKSDVFSFGIVLLEVIVGHASLVFAPHTDDGNIVLEAYRRSEDLDKMGHEHPLRPLVLSCIAHDPQQRPAAADLVNVLGSFKEENSLLRSRDELEGSCSNGRSVHRIPADQYDYEFKVMMVGEIGVGKTSIVNKFVNPNRPFQEWTPSTMQFGEHHERIQLKGKSVLLQLFDTCGELNIHSIIPQLYRGTHGAVVVFDVTSWDTLVKVRQWVSMVRERCGPDIPIILAGNKTDSEDRQVDTNTAENVCEEFKLFYIEVSAKTGKNVDEAFSVLTEQLMQQKQQGGASASCASLQPYKRKETVSNNNLGARPRVPLAITNKAPAKPKKIEKDPDSVVLEGNNNTDNNNRGENNGAHEQQSKSCC